MHIRSTPSGSPRTTVSEVLGLTSGQQRLPYQGTPELRYFGHEVSQQPITQLQQLPPKSQQQQNMSFSTTKPSFNLNTSGVRTNPSTINGNNFKNCHYKLAKKDADLMPKMPSSAKNGV